MDNPGLSLFNGGQSLQLDAVIASFDDGDDGDHEDHEDEQVGQQEREEEEEDREEARRIDAELAQRLEGAFDDLDFDDDDDSSLCSPPGGFNHVVLLPFT